MVSLPDTKNEEYKFTPITRELTRLFDWSAPGAPANWATVDRLLIPGLSGSRIVFLNGRFSEQWSNCSGINRAPARLASAVDAFEMLNAELGGEQLTVIQNGIQSEQEPLMIYHLFDSTAGPAAAHPRIEIELEAGAVATVIEYAQTIGSHPTFLNRVLSAKLGPGANLSWYQIQRDAAHTYQVNNTAFHISPKAVLNCYTLTTNGAMVRNNLGMRLEERAEGHFYGLYAVSGRTHVDNHTVADHLKPSALSNELYKGILMDQSKAVFNGKIFVRPDAQKTNAFQSNRNILLSDQATIHTKPQLEIWADDVKCSHGCTSGQLDEEALFYLRSRGIGEQVAKGMLLKAFAAEVFAQAPPGPLHDFLDTVVSERLAQLQ